MGQQGKFLLSKVPTYMFWKYQILTKFNVKNIYFNSKIIHQIMIFLLRKDLYFLYFTFFRKKYDFDNIINNFEEMNMIAKKNIRNFMRKANYTQLKITKYDQWFILQMLLYSTDFKENEFIIKANESFFRYRHLYLYLLSNNGDF